MTSSNTGSHESANSLAEKVTMEPRHWKLNLSNILRSGDKSRSSTQSRENREREAAENFFSLVRKVFSELKVALEDGGRRVDIHVGRQAYVIDVSRDNRTEFSYAVKLRASARSPSRIYKGLGRNSSSSCERVQTYSATRSDDITEKRLIRDFLSAYQSTTAPAKLLAGNRTAFMAGLVSVAVLGGALVTNPQATEAAGTAIQLIATAVSAATA